MTYIIENINVFLDGQLKRTSFIVDKGRISSISPSVSKFKYMRMSGETFILTPTHVILNSQIPDSQSFQKQRDFYTENFIEKGCTTWLTYFEIQYEFELQQKQKHLEQILFNCPIDYVIGVKIPLRVLTPDFIRECKKRKIPAIFVKIEKYEDLYQKPWGWIREAMFPYNSVLIPIFEKKMDHQQEKETWKQMMAKEKIPSFREALMEQQPISKANIAKIGIFPVKASLMQGAEISYNLYRNDLEENEYVEEEFCQKNANKLLVTVHKDKVIRAGGQIQYIPGYGEHVKIKIPSFFTYNENKIENSKKIFKLKYLKS